MYNQTTRECNINSAILEMQNYMIRSDGVREIDAEAISESESEGESKCNHTFSREQKFQLKMEFERNKYLTAEAISKIKKSTLNLTLQNVHRPSTF